MNPYQDSNGMWGYKTKNQPTIEPQYWVANPFTKHCIATVLDSSNQWYYIDSKGRKLFHSLVYDNGPDYYYRGMARFIRNGKVGFHDSTGLVVIDPVFDYTLPFYAPLAAFCTGCKMVEEKFAMEVHGGYWGFINQTGKVVVSPEYLANEIRPNRDKWVEIKIEGIWRKIGPNGIFYSSDSLNNIPEPDLIRE